MCRMAEGNGEIPIEEVPGKDSDIGRTPDYRKLIDYGLDPKVILLICLMYIAWPYRIYNPQFIC